VNAVVIAAAFCSFGIVQLGLQGSLYASYEHGVRQVGGEVDLHRSAPKSTVPIFAGEPPQALPPVDRGSLGPSGSLGIADSNVALKELLLIGHVLPSEPRLGSIW
jgi:hypothetical protein